MLILVTGGTGKVGRHVTAALRDDSKIGESRIRALCHNRMRDETDRVVSRSFAARLPRKPLTKSWTLRSRVFSGCWRKFVSAPRRDNSDNSKAKYLLGWQPKYNFEMLIDSARQYERSKEEPRIVWYPG